MFGSGLLVNLWNKSAKLEELAGLTKFHDNTANIWSQVLFCND